MNYYKLPFLSSSIIIQLPLLLFLSIFFIYSLCAFPTADDFGYGLIHPFDSTVLYYKNSHGRYFSNALISYVMSHDNFIFAYRFFFSLSYMLFFISISTINSLLFGNKKVVYTISLLLIATFLFRLPARTASYYWLAAHCNYFFSINLFLCSFISFLLSKRVKSTPLSICLAIFSGIFSFLCIGSNEYYIMIMPIFWTFFYFSNAFLLKNKSLTENYQLIIIILFSLIAMLIAALSPGHFNRHQGLSFETFSFLKLIKVLFLSFIDFFNSMLRIIGNPLFLISLPLLSGLYFTSNNIKSSIERLKPYRHKISLFIILALLFPFTLAQYAVGNITPRALLPSYFTLYIAIYFILFLYLKSKFVKNILEKLFRIKRYLILIFFISILPSVPFNMWLEIGDAFSFRKAQEDRMKIIQKSYSKDINKRNVVFNKIESRPLVLKYWDIQDKDRFNFNNRYCEFMKINKVTLK